MSCQSDDPGELATQPALSDVQSARIGEGARNISSSICCTDNGVEGKDLGPSDLRAVSGLGGEMAPEGKLDLLVNLDFRMTHDLRLFRRRAADGHLVRKVRPEHLTDMHPFIHPLQAAVPIRPGSQNRLGNLRSIAKKFPKWSRVGNLGQADVVNCRSCTTPRRNRAARSCARAGKK